MTSLTPISQTSGLSLHCDSPPHSDRVPPLHQSLILLLSPYSLGPIVLILSTLAELGITGSALTWFISYLTKSTSQVTWNGSLSKPCFLETGVPQGSVPGPLLFSLYTRSLGSAITSHGFFYHCYADLHTQLVFSFPFYSDTHFATRTPECLADVAAANPL